MKDPLRIFTPEQLKNLNLYNLRRLKKEFYIPIRFGGATTVILNNHEVDKAALDEIFEELESNFDKYVIDLESEDLNNFFSFGSLEFLTNEDDLDKVKNIIKHHPDIEHKIARKLSSLITPLCQNINRNSFNTLNLILQFTSSFQLKNRDIAYQHAFLVLKHKIDKLNSEYTDPFISHNSVAYKSDIGQHVDDLMAEMFNYLPETFKALDKAYCQWCHYAIVLRTIARNTNLAKFKKRDLKIFIEAMKIASRHFDSDSMKSNIKSATKALNKSGSSSVGISIIGVIAAIFSIAQLVGNLASPSSNSSRYKPLSQEYEIVNYQDLLQKKRNLQSGNGSTIKKTAIDSINAQKTAESTNNKKAVAIDNKAGFSHSELSRHFAGDKWQLILPNQTQLRHNNDTVMVTYEADLFPAVSHKIKNFLPFDTRNVDSPEFNVAKISFINSDLNLRTSHLINLKYRKNDTSVTGLYDSRQSDTNAKLALSAKRIPYGEFNVKGIILRKDTKSGNTKEKVKFNIKYDLVNKLFKVNYGKNQKLEITKSEVRNPYENQIKESISMKFACIINNLGLLHNKYLSKGNYYRMPKIATYRIKPESNINENTSSVHNEKGNLRFNFSSMADNHSYCELNSKRTSLRYILDQRTGITQSMTSVTVSTDKNEVEQVFLARQE